MIPKIINSKTWEIDPEQLRILDENILSVYPDAKLSVGVKYGRWAEVQEYNQAFSEEFVPDYVFEGKIFGQDKTILMWLPFFQ